MIKTMTITKNRKRLGAIDIDDNLVCTVSVVYAKRKRSKSSDLFIQAGYLDKNKNHHTTIIPLDVTLKSGDSVVVKVL